MHEPNIRPLRHQNKIAKTNVYEGNGILRTIWNRSIFMRPPLKEMDEDRIDLILMEISMDQERKGTGRRLRKYYKKNTKYM
jgi:hypothetical protein